MTGFKSNCLLLASILLLAACSVINPQTGAASPTPLLTVSATPTLLTTTTQPDTTPSPGNALWATYQNKTYGFSFEYPAIYEIPPYKATCGLRDLGSSVTIGARIELAIYPAGGLALEDFARQFLSSKDWVLENQDTGLVGGVSAINVNYRFGGPNRFGTLTFLQQDSVVLALGFTSGSFCADLPREDDEASTYQHILDTFQFIK